MPRSARLDLRFTPELLDSIDTARGDVSRNRWIERACEGALRGVGMAPDGVSEWSPGPDEPLEEVPVNMPTRARPRQTGGRRV